VNHRETKQRRRIDLLRFSAPFVDSVPPRRPRSSRSAGAAASRDRGVLSQGQGAVNHRETKQWEKDSLYSVSALLSGFRFSGSLRCGGPLLAHYLHRKAPQLLGLHAHPEVSMHPHGRTHTGRHVRMRGGPLARVTEMTEQR